MWLWTRLATACMCSSQPWNQYQVGEVIKAQGKGGLDGASTLGKEVDLDSACLSPQLLSPSQR